MNPWVERALIGAVGSLASTAVWFGSAKNRDGTPRRKRRRKRKKSEPSIDENAPDENAEGEQMATSEDAAKRKKPSRSADAAPAATGTTASRDLKDFEDGMSTAQFKENVTNTAKGVTGFFRGLVRRDKSQSTEPSEPGEDAVDENASERRSGKESADAPKRRRKKTRSRRKKKDGLAQLKEEAVYLATSAVKKKVVEGTGIDKAAGAIKDGAQSLKGNLVEGGQVLSKKLKSVVPENLGDKMTDARDSVTGAYEKVAERVRAEVSDGGDLSDKMEDGLRDLGRWIQGPGAQDDDDDAPGPDLLAPAKNPADTPSNNIVEAKLPDDEPPRDLPR